MITQRLAKRIVQDNNLPTHATGQFPICQSAKAFEYDRNPNRIQEQTILLRLPAEPAVPAGPSWVPMGMIGFALSGVAIFNADLDECHGTVVNVRAHRQVKQMYHYRFTR